MDQHKDKIIRSNVCNQVGVPKITDLPDECLERILGFLKWYDVYSAALANKRFNDAAVFCIKQKRFDCFNVYKYVCPLKAIHIGNDLWIPSISVPSVNQPNGLTFIRLFGNCGPYLNVSDVVDAERIKNIKDYVTKYCSEVNVNLKFIIPPRKIPNHPTCKYKTLLSIVQLMHETPQASDRLIFRCKYIHGAFVRTLFLALSQQLETLSIKCNYYRFSPSKNFIFDNIRQFSLFQNKDYVSLKKYAQKTPPPIAFTQLETLKLGGLYAFTDDWLNFIISNQGLIELDLLDFENTPIEKSQLLNLINCLPNLKVFAVDANLMKGSCIAEFLRGSKHLLNLRIHELHLARDANSFENTLKMEYDKIRANWEVYFDGYGAAFSRRM